MVVALGSKGQPDFTQPIELMMDCHRRIEHFLDVLRRVLDRYRDVGLPDTGWEALRVSLDYFQQAAPRHTADEEQSLFPRLRQCGTPAVHQALAVVDALEAEHRQAEIAHHRLDQIGRKWLTDRRLSPADAGEMDVLLAKLTETYQRHIRIEDQQVFRLASESLDAGSLSIIGQEMKRRRIADPGRPGSRCAQRRSKLTA
ncbi:MAG: hemerythrin domain-containing protein [Phycisphaeraceae bacterium]|nr:hemerythrin domain-containing protein [Phycisphaeraceae bacterium]